MHQLNAGEVGHHIANGVTHSHDVFSLGSMHHVDLVDDTLSVGVDDDGVFLHPHLNEVIQGHLQGKVLRFRTGAITRRLCPYTLQSVINIDSSGDG